MPSSLTSPDVMKLKWIDQQKGKRVGTVVGNQPWRSADSEDGAQQHKHPISQSRRDRMFIELWRCQDLSPQRGDMFGSTWSSTSTLRSAGARNSGQPPSY